jgi:hypothetical protein
MNYWAMEAAEDSPFSLMDDKALSDAVHRLGLSPRAAREVLHAAGYAPLLQLLEPNSEAPASPHLSAPDCVFCSWVPVFSAAARDLFLRFGSTVEDFVPCRFVSRPAAPHFLHLPLDAPPVVDVDQSEFLMMIPADPPIPFHMTKLVLSGEPRAGCFRASIPGHQQVFPELMASQEFKDAWGEAGLSGAEFRCLDARDTKQLPAETVS